MNQKPAEITLPKLFSYQEWRASVLLFSPVCMNLILNLSLYLPIPAGCVWVIQSSLIPVQRLFNMLLFHFSHLFLLSQFQLVGDFGGDVFEGNRRPRHPLEAHAVKREAGQLAHLHLPLDEVIAGGVTGHAQQHVALAQLVLAAVGVENLPNLLYHVSGLHGRCGLHAPGEAERARLRLVFKRGHGSGRRCPAPREGVVVFVFIFRPYAGLLRLLCAGEHRSVETGMEREGWRWGRLRECR